MSTPVIGITAGVDRARSGIWDTNAVFLQWTYGSALVAAGAAVTVLPTQPALPDAVAAVLARLDGIIVTGGGDLDPALYGAEPHPKNDAPRRDRDDWELALAAAAIDRGLPYLGICRGTQVLNVARGGSLIQHLPELIGNEEHEGHDDVFGHVEVATVAGTRIAGWHPPSSVVPVYHHQAIDRVGDGLVVGARSSYGVVEEVEDPSVAFCVGVQWHPEQDTRTELFEAFVAAARSFGEAR